MAEQRPQRVTTGPMAMRWRSGPTIAIAAIVVAGGLAPGAPPIPVALTPERPRLAGGRILAPSPASVPVRALRWWARLRLVPAAIRRTPESRSDTPALPTVGRPRDGPGLMPAHAGIEV